MLYVISGASRSGKTLLAKQLSIQKRIPYLSTDWVMMGFTNGMPEFGVHDLLMPDDIAKRLWPFLKAMFESMLHANTDCIIEGEALLPELIVELMEAYPDKLNVCFLGFTNVDVDNKVKDIKAFSTDENDWLMDKSDAYIIDHVENMIVHSKLVKTSCSKYQIRYFDTSDDFSKTIAEAENHLLE